MTSLLRLLLSQKSWQLQAGMRKLWTLRDMEQEVAIAGMVVPIPMTQDGQDHALQ